MAATNYPPSYPDLVITEEVEEVFECFEDLPSDIQVATNEFIKKTFEE